MNKTSSGGCDVLYALALGAFSIGMLPVDACAQVYGADSSVTQSDRFSNGGYTNGPDGVFEGGENFFAASAMLDGSEPDSNGSGVWHRGLSRASSFLSGATTNPLPPVLRAEARLSGMFSTTSFNGSVPIAGASFTQAGAIETYQYTGSVPTTLTLTYLFHYDYFNNGGHPGLSGLAFSCGVLGNVGFYSTHIETLTLEGGAFLLGSGGTDAEFFTYTNATTGGFVTQTIVLPFDVVPGQVFSVVARLQANAVGGTSYADAYSTVSGSFDRPDLITSLSAPAPSAGGLLALGALAASRRRRS